MTLPGPHAFPMCALAEAPHLRLCPALDAGSFIASSDFSFEKDLLWFLIALIVGLKMVPLVWWALGYVVAASRFVITLHLNIVLFTLRLAFKVVWFTFWLAFKVSLLASFVTVLSSLVVFFCEDSSAVLRVIQTGIGVFSPTPTLPEGTPFVRESSGMDHYAWVFGNKLLDELILRYGPRQAGFLIQHPRMQVGLAIYGALANVYERRVAPFVDLPTLVSALIAVIVVSKTRRRARAVFAIVVSKAKRNPRALLAISGLATIVLLAHHAPSYVMPVIEKHQPTFDALRHFLTWVLNNLQPILHAAFFIASVAVSTLSLAYLAFAVYSRRLEQHESTWTLTIAREILILSWTSTTFSVAVGGKDFDVVVFEEISSLILSRGYVLFRSRWNASSIRHTRLITYPTDLINDTTCRALVPYCKPSVVPPSALPFSIPFSPALPSAASIVEVPFTFEEMVAMGYAEERPLLLLGPPALVSSTSNDSVASSCDDSVSVSSSSTLVNVPTRRHSHPIVVRGVPQEIGPQPCTCLIPRTFRKIAPLPRRSSEMPPNLSIFGKFTCTFRKFDLGLSLNMMWCVLWMKWKRDEKEAHRKRRWRMWLRWREDEEASRKRRRI